MRDRQRKYIHRRVRFLKESAPLSMPISVRICEFSKEDKDFSGYTTTDGHGIRISINRKLNYQLATDALIHEWAHARRLCKAFEHGDDWGKEYARLCSLEERYAEWIKEN